MSSLQSRTLWAGAWSTRVPALLLGLLALSLLLWTGPIASAQGTDEGPQWRPGEPLIGVELNWAGDSAEEFAGRLGAVPAFYGFNLHLPLTGQATTDLQNVSIQAAEQGAGLLITILPHTGFEGFGSVQARTVATTVYEATKNLPGPVLVRFGPQMNTPWVGWGMQPTAYVEAYRESASALRAQSPRLQMVWSPQTGMGYPFPLDGSSPARQVAPDAATEGVLDTNQDGVLNPSDDAYSPFYPGDEWVDWVGLYALYSPEVEPGTATPVPRMDLAQEMIGAASGTDPNGFYQRYAVGRDKPLLLDTAAAYQSGAGPAESEVKAAWWDQVLRLPGFGYDQLGAIVWHELRLTDETGQVTDQRVASSPQLAAAFRSLLDAQGTRLGPIVEPVSLDGVRTTGVTLDRTGSWIVVASLLGSVVLIWAAATWVPPFRRLAYPDAGRRDLRVDFLRGMAILFVVVDHVGLTSLFHLASQEAIGIVSGAELFVILAGIILGIVSRPRMAIGMYEAVDRGWARARKLYLWALLVPLSVFALSFIPWLNTTPVTTFSVPSAGPVLSDSPPTTYDMFSGLEGLLHYPADPAVVPRLLGLQFGPWQFNILGLYVILLLVSPFVLHALHRGWTLQVLVASVGLYVLAQVTGVRVLPFQSDDAFPILAWQLLFVLGLVAGFFRLELMKFVRGRPGQLVLLLCSLAAVAFILLSWNNPFLSNVYDVRLSLIPDQQFYAMYEEWFGRTWLRPGRLLNVIVVVVGAFALLTVLWKPINALLGWLLIPLGEATLYVFILHVFVIIVITNIPLIAFGNIWLNTVAYAIVIMALWVMVKTRFLSGIIPR